MKLNNLSKFQELSLTIILALLVAVLARTASVQDWPYTDPKGSLLSGQALVEHGSFNLQPYAEQLEGYAWQLYWKEGSIHYAYPYGTTILHLPVIWLGTKSGLDLSNPHAEAALNRTLAAISIVFAFLLIMALFRRRCEYLSSLLFSLIIVLGSGIFSTMGLALWNLNYAVIMALLVLLILDQDTFLERPDTGWLLGILLFLGFIIRPSFALFILMVFGYLVIYRPAHFVRAAVGSAVPLAFYLLFSLNTFGSILPGHYKMQDFSDTGDLLINFAALWISPSRGLLTFSPFFLVTLIGAVLYRDKWRSSQLLSAVGIWLMVLLLFLSSWFMWWGGGGFGNRLLVETLPAWIYLSAVFWPEMWASKSYITRMVTRLALPVLGIFSIWIHLAQGANNQWTVTWYHHPNKDQYPEYFWNYRFPQQFANENQIERMSAWHEERKTTGKGMLVKSLTVGDPSIRTLSGWSDIEGRNEKWLWSLGKEAVLEIDPQALNLQGPTQLILELDASTYGNQRIEVFINDVLVKTIQTENGVRSLYVTDPIQFVPGDLLRIRVQIDDPKVPAIEERGRSSDPRELGICLFHIEVYSR